MTEVESTTTGSSNYEEQKQAAQEAVENINKNARATSSKGSRSSSDSIENLLSSPASSHHPALEDIDIPKEPPTQQNQTPKRKGTAEMASEGEKKKQDMMSKLKPDPNKKANEIEIKGERKVKDPVTGKDVIIKDARFEDFGQDPKNLGSDRSDRHSENKLSSAALDPGKSHIPGPSTLSPAQVDPSSLAPNPAKPGNILLQPFPPAPSSTELHSTFSSLSKVIIGACGVVWVLTCFRCSWARFFMGSTGIASVAGLTWLGLGYTEKQVEKEWDRVRGLMQKSRGEEFSPPTPESVEWLNAFLTVIFPLISPSLFDSTIGMVEDIMQQSLPSFMTGMKISDFGLGTNPIRIVSMRALPDKEGTGEAWIDESGKGTHEKTDRAKIAEEEEEGGEYVNLEVSFIYLASSSKASQLKKTNIHLLISFFVNALGLTSFHVPIWAQIEGFAGTVRMRMQFVPQMPLVRNCRITLMGTPAVEVSVQPMISKLPNVLDLPGISGFVKNSIAAACAAYVAPNSLTLNLAQILTGDGIKKDVDALGVLTITLHSGEGLSAEDVNGLSDPYVIFGFSKLGKPLYRSRTIDEDLNPSFEETFEILITKDEIDSEEDLVITFWDHDDELEDDLIGRFEIPLKELIGMDKNKWNRRRDELLGFSGKGKAKGFINWSFGFWEKVSLKEFATEEQRKSLASIPPPPTNPSNTPAPPPPDPKIAEDSLVLSVPPPTDYPSGILSVIVHQINNLERINVKNSGLSAFKGVKEGEFGQDTDENDEMGNNMPSSYCEILIDDELAHKTRVKQYTNMPYFEAGTEKFVRDWKTTTVRIVVRDSKMNKKDPILGIVLVDLADLFKDRCQKTKLWALSGGEGFGRVNVGILFRPVRIQLPKNFMGWSTGTFEIISPIKLIPAQGKENDKSLDTKKLEIKVSGNHEIKIKDFKKEGDAMIWNVEPDLRIPIYNRYQASVVFSVGSGIHFLGLGDEDDAFSTIWLQDVPDGEPKSLKIPVLKSKNTKTLSKNYINEWCARNHHFEAIGTLELDIRMSRGLDEDHSAAAAKGGENKKHAFEVFDQVTGRGKGEGNAPRAEVDTHDSSLVDKINPAHIKEKVSIGDKAKKLFHIHHHHDE